MEGFREWELHRIVIKIQVTIPSFSPFHSLIVLPLLLLSLYFPSLSHFSFFLLISFSISSHHCPNPFLVPSISISPFSFPFSPLLFPRFYSSSVYSLFFYTFTLPLPSVYNSFTLSFSFTSLSSLLPFFSFHSPLPFLLFASHFFPFHLFSLSLIFPISILPSSSPSSSYPSYSPSLPLLPIG